MNYLKTPVLLIVYKRLHTTEKVLESISKAKPSRLYISSNAPNPLIPDDREKVTEVRNLIDKWIDWPCDVTRFFKTEHLSASESICSAITSFFEHEEEGIILEDDCVVTTSFYFFAEECLRKYRHEDKIMHIGASNFQKGNTRGDASYYYSRYNHIWGWASWRRAWMFKNSLNPKDFDQKRIEESINTVFYRRQDRTFWSAIVKYGKSWDFQWMFFIWTQGGFAITPRTNMVENIGFGNDATNTMIVTNNIVLIKGGELQFPLQHNDEIRYNDEADLYTSDHFFRISQSYKLRHLKIVISHYLPGLYKLLKILYVKLKKD